MGNSEIVIYQSIDGVIKIDVRLEDETVWLTQAQMGQLFGKSRTTITEHIRNIFTEGELQENVVCRNFRHTTQHGAIEDAIARIVGRAISGICRNYGATTYSHVHERLD
jgi:hypothetical protein